MRCLYGRRPYSITSEAKRSILITDHDQGRSPPLSERSDQSLSMFYLDELITEPLIELQIERGPSNHFTFFGISLGVSI